MFSKKDLIFLGTMILLAGKGDQLITNSDEEDAVDIAEHVFLKVFEEN